MRAGKIFANAGHRQTGTIFARSPHNPDLIVVGTQGSGLLRSTDNGLTWSAGGPPVYVTDVLFDRTTPERLWVCALPTETGGERFEGGFFRSNDGGRSVDWISATSPSEIVQSLGTAPLLVGIFGSARVRMSKDGGETWSDYSENLPGDDSPKDGPEHLTSAMRYTGLAVGPDFVVTVNAKGGLHLRGQNDTAWRPIPRGQQPRANFGDGAAWVGIDARNPSMWFMTSWHGCFRSTDAGVTWATASQGIQAHAVTELGPSPGRPAVVHFGTADTGYYRSTDSGLTFARSSSGVTNGTVIKVVGGASSPDQLYQLVAGKHYAPPVSLQRSSDGGETWERVAAQGLPSARDLRCNAITVSPSDSRQLLATVSGSVGAGRGGVYRSTDGGDSWSWFGEGLTTGRPFFSDNAWARSSDEVAMSSDGSAVVAGAGAGVVAFLDRNGSSPAWRPVPSRGGGGMAVEAAPAEPGVFYLLVRGSGIQRSADGGRTWAQLNSGPFAEWAVDPARPGRLAVATAETVFISTDSGKTWNDLDPRRCLPQLPAAAIAFAGERILVSAIGVGTYAKSL